MIRLMIGFTEMIMMESERKKKLVYFWPASAKIEMHAKSLMRWSVVTLT